MKNKPLIDDAEGLAKFQTTSLVIGRGTMSVVKMDPDELAQLVANTEALREVRVWAKGQAQCQDLGGENGREILTIIDRHIRTMGTFTGCSCRQLEEGINEEQVPD